MNKFVITSSILFSTLILNFCTSCNRAEKGYSFKTIDVILKYEENKAKLEFNVKLLGQGKENIKIGNDVIPGDKAVIKYKGTLLSNIECEGEFKINGRFESVEFKENLNVVEYYFSYEEEYQNFVKTNNVEYIILDDSLNIIKANEHFSERLYKVEYYETKFSGNTCDRFQIQKQCYYSFLPRQ